MEKEEDNKTTGCGNHLQQQQQQQQKHVQVNEAADTLDDDDDDHETEPLLEEGGAGDGCSTSIVLQRPRARVVSGCISKEHCCLNNTTTTGALRSLQLIKGEEEEQRQRPAAAAAVTRKSKRNLHISSSSVPLFSPLLLRVSESTTLKTSTKKINSINGKRNKNNKRTKIRSKEAENREKEKEEKNNECSSSATLKSYKNRKATSAIRRKNSNLKCSSLFTLTTVILFFFFFLILNNSNNLLQQVQSKSLEEEQSTQVGNTILSDNETVTSNEITTPITKPTEQPTQFSNFIDKLKSAFRIVPTTPTPTPTTSPETTTTIPFQIPQTTTTAENLETNTNTNTNTETGIGTGTGTGTTELVDHHDSSIEDDDDDAQGCAGLSADKSTETKNLSDNERLVNLQACLQKKIRSSFINNARIGLEMFDKLSLTGGCSSSLFDLVSNFGELRSFAFKFLDASAKIPNGVFAGLLTDYGDFDQCLSIRSQPQVEPENEVEERAYSGKYCLIGLHLNYTIKLNSNETVPKGIKENGIFWEDTLVRRYWTSEKTKSFQLGACLPSRCTNDDIEQLIKLMSDSYKVVGSIINCQDSLDLKRQYKADLIQKVIIYSFGVLMALTVLGTLLDRYCSPAATKESELDERRLSSASSISSFSFPDHNHNHSTTTNLSAYQQVLTIFICFSISKNWKTFMRKPTGNLSLSPPNEISEGWDCLTSSHDGAAECCSEEITNGTTTNTTATKNRLEFRDFDSGIPTTTTTTTQTDNVALSNLVSAFNSQQQQQQQESPTNGGLNGTYPHERLYRQLTVRIQPSNVDLDNFDNQYQYKTNVRGVRIQGGGGGGGKGEDSNQDEMVNNGGINFNHLFGLKLFIIIWITMGQSFLYPSAHNYQYYRSIISLKITSDSVWFATTNFTLGIDMLLYMAGMMFVFKLANNLNNNNNNNQLTTTKSIRNSSSSSSKKQQASTLSLATIRLKLNSGRILQVISRKILRLWPTYLTVIAFAIVLPIFSDGPMWPEMVTKRLGESCRQNWWSNILFVNNLFFIESEICLPSSWFVSVLMQLFLIGSFIIILVRKVSVILGLVTLALLLICSSLASFAYAYIVNVRAPMLKMDESFVLELDENIFRLYTNVLNNLGPFLIGMAGGFLLIRTQMISQRHNDKERKNNNSSSPSSESKAPGNKKKDIRQSIWAQYSGYLYQTLLAILILLIALLVLSSVFHQNYSPICSAIYWSLHRIGWAIVTGYLIHNCSTGRWKLLNDILSLSTFIPLSRLIFIAYLVFPLFIHIHSGLVRDGLHVSIYNMLNIYITRLVMTFATALAIHLLVELPFCSIEEIYLNKWIRKLFIKSGNDYKTFFKSPLLAVAPVVSMPSYLSENSRTTTSDNSLQEETSSSRIEVEKRKIGGSNNGSNPLVRSTPAPSIENLFEFRRPPSPLP